VVCIRFNSFIFLSQKSEAEKRSGGRARGGMERVLQIYVVSYNIHGIILQDAALLSCSVQIHGNGRPLLSLHK